MTTQTIDQTKHNTSSTSSLFVLIQNVAAAIFGITILFAVGFLPTDAAHNAAHDTRHALAFPCH